jgi:acyl carrier protein
MSAEIIDRIRKAFASVIGENAAQGVVPGATMEDVEGWDSLNFLNLVMAIEDEFDLQMSTLEAASLNTVDAVVSYVERKTS